MSEHEIKAKIRTGVGKSDSRRLRRAGEIPCILYGIEKDTVNLSVGRRAFEKLISETRSVFVVDYGDVKQRSVIKEIQYHPVKGTIIHVDLQRIKAGQEISVSVPLKFIGASPGVKMGGIFQELKADLDITCLPKYLPDNLEVDISELNIGDSIHVSDLHFEHITIEDDATTSICSVVPPRKVEEILPEEEEEEMEEAAEPEVIGAKEKAEEEDEESQG